MTNKNRLKFIITLAITAVMAFSICLGGIFGANAQSVVSYHKSDIFEAAAGIKEIKCGEEFYSQFHVYNGSLDGEKGETMLVPKSYSGVAVYGSGGTMDFSYKHAINMSKKTVSDSLIEIYPMFDQFDDGGNLVKDFAKIVDIRITLTDTEDPTNTVAIHFDDSTDGFAIYTRALYRGKDISYSANRTNPIYNGIRGTYLQNCAYNYYHSSKVPNSNKWVDIAWERGEISPFTMHLDYETKGLWSSFYSSYGVFSNRSILDLDDPKQVGAGYEWKGFEKDTAYLSVQVSFSEAISASRQGGVFIKSIDGINLEGDFASEEDLPTPTITPNTFDEYGKTLPYGGVGIDYDIPSVYAHDYFFGIADSDNVSYVIEKLDGEEYVETNYTGKNGGTHKFNEVGSYRVKYTVNNSVKSASDYVEFEIREQIVNILIDQVEDYQTPVLGKYIVIPEAVVTGGSGNLVKTETLYYNGQEIALTDSRDVLVDKPGIISLKVECHGYTGDPVIKYFPVKVEDGVVIKVGEMPKAIKGEKAETLTLPKATAYNTADGQSVPVSITIDGEPVGADRKISTAKTEGTVSVVYKAGQTVEEYSLKVVGKTAYIRDRAQLFIANGNVTAENTTNGVVLTTSENNASVTWAYPIITGYSNAMSTFIISQTSESLDFEYVDIIFSDFKEEQKDFYIRIYKDNLIAYSTSEVSVKINGVDKIFAMNGSINTVGSSFTFYIDGNAIYNVKNNLIYDFTDLYSAKMSYVTIAFGGVQGASSIRINKLGNQNLYGTKDENAVVELSKKLAVQTVIALGSTFVIPNFAAHDVTSFGSSATVTVVAPNEEKIIDRAENQEKLSFTSEMLGQYEIIFATTDGHGRVGNIIFKVKVVDNVNPVLTINGKVKTELPVGKKIVFPSATAVDDLDGNCQVRIFVRRLDTYKLVAVSGTEFTFTACGKYEIIYQTHDNSWNYTQHIFTVNVQG